MRSIPFKALRLPAPADPASLFRWSTTEILAIIAVGATVLVSTASLSSNQLLGAILALGGLALVIRWRSTPVGALAVVMFLALSSRPTIEVASVNIRVEQLSILFLAGYSIFTGRDLIGQLLRRYWLLIAGLVMWFAAAAASSALVAPDPVVSLRIVIWLGISFIAAGVAAMLAARAQHYELVTGAIVLATALHVGIAILAAASGPLLGVEWGGVVRSGSGYGFRAAGLAWEPNIFASGTAISVPLAMAQYIKSGRRAHLVLVGILGLGVWVALTRTVLVALALGVVVYLGLLIWREAGPRRRSLPRFAGATLALAIGVASGAVVNVAMSTTDLGPLAIRHPSGADAVLPATPTLPTPRPSAIPSPGRTIAPSSSLNRSEATPPILAPPPSVLPIDLGDTSNLEFRLVRLQLSLDDLAASPWIGLGANSFGQRHADPSQEFRADYFGMLPFTVLYDAGVIGFAAFILFVASTGVELLRWRLYLMATAFGTTLAIMLISYVMTDALRFASNWIVIGAGLGLAHRWRVEAET